MRTGAAYVRVSTEDQIEYSPDSQIKKIFEYAQLHDIVLQENFIFTDEGISGRSAQNRPAFMRMIGMAKKTPKPFEVILLWKFSRFARNRQDSIFYKSMLRKDCGIEVLSITEQLSDDPTAILVEALLEAMDEYYSINLAQEVRRGMNEKFTRGGVVSTPPFGYHMGNQTFEKDLQAALLVRMIFDDYLSGLSYRRIASKLNAMGIRTERGSLFENRTVEYILTNPVYTGKLRRCMDTKDRSDRFLCGPEVSLVEGGHEPIVSQELFAAVQQRRNTQKRVCARQAHTGPADFMLRGLVRCSHCGATLIRSSDKKSLQCHRYAKGQCSVSHSIRLEQITALVLDRTAQDIGMEELHLHTSPACQKCTEEVVPDLLLREYRRLERVNAAYEDGADTLEEYTAKKDAVKKHIAYLEQNAVGTCSRAERLSGEEVVRLKDIFAWASGSKVSESWMNELLRTFVSKIIYSRTDHTIRIYYSF